MHANVITGAARIHPAHLDAQKAAGSNSAECRRAK
jgi:hypothetical protein